MRFTDMADEMFGAAQGALPAGVRLATAKRGGVTITRVEIAREGLAKPRGRYVTLEMPSVSVLDERDAAVIETCAAELRALLPPEGPVLVLGCPVVYSIDIPEVCHTVSAHIQIFLLSSQSIQLLILLISCP